MCLQGQQHCQRDTCHVLACHLLGTACWFLLCLISCRSTHAVCTAPWYGTTGPLLAELGVACRIQSLPGCHADSIMTALPHRHPLTGASCPVGCLSSSPAPCRPSTPCPSQIASLPPTRLTHHCKRRSAAYAACCVALLHAVLCCMLPAGSQWRRGGGPAAHRALEAAFSGGGGGPAESSTSHTFLCLLSGPARAARRLSSSPDTRPRTAQIRRFP